MARRAIRIADLLNEKRFAEKLAENLDYHNFVLEHYLKAPNVDFQKTLDDALAYVPRLRPMVTDVSSALYAAHKAGANLLFEGAQGSLLDVDHGTYPFVTSSNCVAGNAAAGCGRRSRHAALHPGHHQGLHHARRLRPVPVGTADRCRRRPSPGASGP